MDKALKSAKSERAVHGKTAKGGLTVKAYRGDGSAMLAFDLDEKQCENLAGFSIKRTAPDGKSCYLSNHLSFTSAVTADTRIEELGGEPSSEAPFQKFHWIDVVEDVQDGKYQYDVTAMFFTGGGKLKAGPSVNVGVEILPTRFGNFEYGFTRGYLSSQAYAHLFKNAPIRPAKKAIDYPTKDYQKQYEWLGFHARKLVFDFLDECVKDKSITVDLFAYDLDEPDFLRVMQKLGKRLRAFLDNAPLHTKPGALEIEAHKLLVKSAGAANVKQGHFHRFAHNKVMIMKKNGKPIKVLTGSANFSVRGLYVQANNILIFEDEQTAQLYEEAFEQSFNDAAGFATSAIAEGWHDVEDPGLPRFSVCFSPHHTAEVSLQKVADTIKQAKSSVIFAVMELAGGGAVMDELKTEAKEKNIFSYGMSQTMGGIKVYKPGHANAMIVPFAFLKGKVPPPFQDEYSGGGGIVIHDKFVVVDFNGTNPVVFTGSSNLASGGEMANGDNLIAIYDESVATAYAIEAIRLINHYHFRATMQQASDDKPMVLQTSAAKDKWWEPYYDQKNILFHERVLFSR
jgi:phosphatidylserine/phosphatidylglycerophosphate/cardiolipin synthase-like enzyme